MMWIFLIFRQKSHSGHDFIYTTIIIEDNGVSNSVKTDFNGNSQTLMKLRKLVNYIQDFI